MGTLRRRGLGLSWALLLVACAGEPRQDATASTKAEPVAEPGPAVAESAVEVQEDRLWIDVREPRAFAEGHAPGALNLQLTWKQLGERLPAYVPDRSRGLSIHAADQGQWEAAESILVQLGYTDFLRAEPSERVSLPLMTAVELRERLMREDPPIVLDVRTPGEWSGEVIEGALQVEAASAPEILPRLDPQREYAVICEGGVRSSQLASLLVAEGFPAVSNVIDGMWAWRRLDE